MTQKHSYKCWQFNRAGYRQPIVIYQLTMAELPSSTTEAKAAEESHKSQVEPQRFKTFKDPIHGEIRLHPVLVAIIDTPEFQRLRNIKQLGNKHLVYPGATHTRFEHSIGVAHLAGEFLKMIKENTGTEWKELGVTEKDELCVQIAALCHDLGHGPFSHLFERFLRRVGNAGWKHEEASGKMLDYLLERCELPPDVQLDEDDKLFIKELIDPKDGQGSKRRCDPKKNFLYEIVANKSTGIDVDKWDYFERDATYMGLPRNFDSRRTLQLARVITVGDEKTHICIRDKEVFNLYQMFHTRYSLYKRGLCHPVCIGVELMLTDILVKADEHLRFPSSEGSHVKMSEAVNDMAAYTLLTDELLQQIRVSREKDLEESRELLTRLERRDLYSLVAFAVPRLRPCKECGHKEYKLVLGKGQDLVPVPSAQQILTDAECDQESSPHPYAQHFVVHLVEYDYGANDQNPLKDVRFYSKEPEKPSEPFKIPREKVSPMLPQVFKEQELRLYCKMSKDHRQYEAVQREGMERFKKWCKDKGMEVPDST